MCDAYRKIMNYDYLYEKEPSLGFISKISKCLFVTKSLMILIVKQTQDQNSNDNIEENESLKSRNLNYSYFNMNNPINSSSKISLRKWKYDGSINENVINLKQNYYKQSNSLLDKFQKEFKVPEIVTDKSMFPRKLFKLKPETP